MATTLSTQISALATQVGTDIKQILANVGDLSQLTTTQKSSLVVAINELKASIQDVADSVGATIKSLQLREIRLGLAKRSMIRLPLQSMPW